MSAGGLTSEDAVLIALRSLRTRLLRGDDPAELRVAMFGPGTVLGDACDLYPTDWWNEDSTRVERAVRTAYRATFHPDPDVRAEDAENAIIFFDFGRNDEERR